MGRLDAKVALVTGAGSGIGRGIVERFVAEGARVGMLDSSRERLTELAEDLGPSVVAHPGDVSVYADNAGAVRATVEAFGCLDIFVGNAGIYDSRVRLKDLSPETLECSFDELFGVDVKGYLLGVRAALDELRKNEGCVVFTASISGVAPGFGGVLYVPAKHAVIGLTGQLAYELAPRIRVNAVAPGYVATGLSDPRSLGSESVVLPAPGAVAPRMPLGRVPGPSDVSGIYVLLASEEGRFLTGSTVRADGGQVLWGPPD